MRLNHVIAFLVLVFCGPTVLSSYAEPSECCTEGDGGAGGWSVFIGLDEASGPKYRKVGLNGFPISDERPQQKPETDEEPEETYIDGFNHNLCHQVTDVYVPFQGTDLTLSIRRNWSPDIWNLNSGLKPEGVGAGRPDQPFGVGWKSNLSASVQISYSMPPKPEHRFAIVTDLNGATYRFLILQIPGETDYQFLPLPSNSSQMEVAATSLEMKGEDGFVFTSDYGTKLTFGPLEIERTVSSMDGLSGEIYKWARLQRATDRYGTTLSYSYSGSDSLTPSGISCRGKSISISSSDGLVTGATDPRGKHTSYSYGSAATGSRLTTVTRADGSKTKYSYETVEEADRFPREFSDLAILNKYYYTDVTSIENPNGEKYQFTYAFDRSRYNYFGNTSTLFGRWFLPCGNPRNVTSVRNPRGSTANFSNNSLLYLGFDPVTNETTLEGQRSLSVTDVAGGGWNYSFGDTKVVNNKAFENLASPLPFTGNVNTALMIFYRSMNISTPGAGSMSATFDMDAGMALKSFRDVSSSNTTSYSYNETLDFPLRLPYIDTHYPDLRDSLPTQKASDPTSQTNGMGGSKFFSYASRQGARIMSSIRDEEGRYINYGIDASGNRTLEEVRESVSGPVVQRTEFDYSGIFSGIMKKKTVKVLSGDTSGALDLVTEYELQSGTGNVLKEKVGNPSGTPRVTEYTYDDNNNKLTSKDPNGNVTGFVYDDLNRLTQVNLPGGVNKKIVYDSRGNKVREDDELGHSTLREYDSMNRVVKEARDMNGNHVIDAGVDLITEMTYNSLGAKTSVKSPNGWTTTMAYDGLNRLTKTTDPYGKETTYEYGMNSGGLQFGKDFQPTRVVDARGFETLTTYDGNYRPTERKVQYAGSGGSKVYATTKWEYDAVGNVLKEYDPLHTTLVPRITQKTYDALNRETSSTWPDLTSTQTQYTSTGLQWKTIDELNNDTLTEYDDAGKPVKVSSPVVDNGFGTNARAVTETTYDAAGNVLTTKNPLGRIWTYTYDNRNRKKTEVKPGTGSPTTEWTYDAVGNVTKVEDAKGNETDTTYDAANRVVEVKQPSVPVFGGGSVRPTTETEYDKNGNATKVTDPNGHETVNTYDKLSRLVKTTDAEGIEVENEYDEVGNRIAVIDGKDQRTEFTYDGLKRNTSVKDAANKSTTFEYNAVDKTARVDALNQRTEYAYDLRHRLTTVSYKDPTGTPVNFDQNATRVYAYDATGNLLSVTEAAKSVANVAYTYDGLKRQLTETSGALTHTYKYDLAGNRLSVIYGGTPAMTLTSTYDEENRLKTLTQGTNVTTYTYDLNGNNLTKELPNGDTTTFVYDDANRTTSMTGVSGASSALYTYAYEYDAGANVKKVTETYGNTALNRVVTNTYDDINRLTEEAVTGSGSATTSYTYDDAHNRSSMAKGGVTTTYTYNNLNQLTGWDDGTKTSVYTYDFNGNRHNQTIDGEWVAEFYWDYENRLLGMNRPPSLGIPIFSVQYDYRSRRVTRVSAYPLSGHRISFSGGVSVRETAIAGSVSSADYVRGSDWGGGVGGILYSLRGGVPSFTHYNRRGDVTAKTDATGAVTYQSQYEAFGKRTTETGATLDPQKSNTKDEDIPGYANEGFRFRDLETGVFLNRDPAGFIDGPNLYAYVLQNPWTAFDPEGLAKQRDYKNRIERNTKKIAQKQSQVDRGKNLGEKSKQRLQNEIKGLRAENSRAQGAIDSITDSAQALRDYTDQEVDVAELDDSSRQFREGQHWQNAGPVMDFFSQLGQSSLDTLGSMTGYTAMGNAQNAWNSGDPLSAVGWTATSFLQAGTSVFTAGQGKAIGSSLEAMPTMSVGGTFGTGGGFHAFYSVTEGGSSTWMHAALSARGGTGMTTQVAPGLAGFSNRWNTLTGIPIFNPAAARATGVPAANCVEGAGSAVLRGWGAK